ncbi:hypothetical protein [Streptomyces cinereoruber]|uniref:hypothetical protein n=1 Tax=Streptomyces cinereoruber TaxID=67260 RepID=UPI00363CDF78
MPARHAPPEAEFLERVVVTSWIERSAAGALCRLLLAPGEPRQGESIGTYLPGMLGLAQGMGLSPVGDGPRRIGWNLLLSNGLVRLDYGHPERTMNVPFPGENWYRQALVSGHAHVLVGLDVLPAGSSAPEVATYIDAASQVGHVWSGITAWRRPT